MDIKEKQLYWMARNSNFYEGIKKTKLGIYMYNEALMILLERGYKLLSEEDMAKKELEYFKYKNYVADKEGNALRHPNSPLYRLLHSADLVLTKNNKIYAFEIRGVKNHKEKNFTFEKPRYYYFNRFKEKGIIPKYCMVFMEERIMKILNPTDFEKNKNKITLKTKKKKEIINGIKKKLKDELNKANKDEKYIFKREGYGGNFIGSNKINPEYLKTRTKEQLKEEKKREREEEKQMIKQLYKEYPHLKPKTKKKTVKKTTKK